MKEQIEWRCQLLSLIIRDLRGRRVFCANFNGECDVCNKPLKQGDPFVFLGTKERTCLHCIDSIVEIFDDTVDKLSQKLLDLRFKKEKLVAPN